MNCKETIIKRLAIFSFYDKNGEVFDYIYELLRQLSESTEKLVFVSNSQIIDPRQIAEVRKYADEVYFRENTGFDAGAYKYAMMKLGREKLQEYEEVILCNDTFFGPFVPLDKILSKMESQKKDFWGLDFCEHNVFDSIRSYFLVFGERIIKNGVLFNFFEDDIDETWHDIRDDLINFENGIFYYLSNQGYTYCTYGKPNDCNLYKSPNYLIKKYQVPVLKKKQKLSEAKVLNNFADAVHWVVANSTYDIRLIDQYFRARYSVNCMNLPESTDIQEYYNAYSDVSAEKISDCSENYKSVYIYGAGIVARRVYCFYNLKNVKAFVVSAADRIEQHSLYQLPVVSLSDIVDRDDALIIVAVNQDNLYEVMPKIKHFPHRVAICTDPYVHLINE